MATQHQVQAQRAEEDRRHNKRTETQASRDEEQRDRASRRQAEATTRGQDLRLLGDVAKIIGGKNDPSWYNKVPQLVKDSSSFSFSNPLGAQMSILRGQPYGGDTFAGVMKLNFIPALGTQGTSLATELKQVANALYSAVRKGNSGGANYDSTDLMMYVLAVGLATEFWAECTRAYSVFKTYKTRNKYYGEQLAVFLGFDRSISTELANFREIINAFAVKINSLAIPKNIPLFSRLMWLGGNIFKDYDTHKSQLYAFVNKYYPVYKDVIGGVQYVLRNPAAPGTIDKARVKAIIDQITTSILENPDLGNISGDIQKFFSEAELLAIPVIDEDYHVEATYSLEVLSQINGATVNGALKAAPSGTLLGTWQLSDGRMGTGFGVTDGTTYPTQIKPLAIVNPFPAGSEPYSQQQLNSRIVNMYKDEVTDLDVMVATRLMCTYAVNVSQNQLEIQASGTEVITEVTLAKIDVANGTWVESSWGSYFLGFTEAAQVGTTLQTLAHFGFFEYDWHPQKWLLEISVSGGISTLYEFRPLFDVVNYSVLSPDALETMHIVAFQSELALVDWVGSKQEKSK